LYFITSFHIQSSLTPSVSKYTDVDRMLFSSKYYHILYRVLMYPINPKALNSIHIAT
jgi:hypothetical protein